MMIVSDQQPKITMTETGEPDWSAWPYEEGQEVWIHVNDTYAKALITKKHGLACSLLVEPEAVSNTDFAGILYRSPNEMRPIGFKRITAEVSAGLHRDVPDTRIDPMLKTHNTARLADPAGAHQNR